MAEFVLVTLVNVGDRFVNGVILQERKRKIVDLYGLVAHAVDRRLCSVRRACTYLNLSRSTYRYVPKRLTDRQEQLYQRLIALSWHHPRYGYRRIRALLAREGWQVSRKQVQRIRRREGLKVREKPKKIPRRGISTGLPTQATHRHHV